MIEIRITKEIGNYKPKFLGPFNLRQVVCLLIGVPVCVAIFKLTSPYLPGDIPGFLCAIPAGIAYLFGWFEPYGMPTEKFIQSVAVNIVMAPSNRRYKIKNTHEVLIRAAQTPEEKATPVKKGVGKTKHAAKKLRSKIAINSKPEYYL